MEGGAKWINPETGEAFLIKGKMAKNQRITLGVDSIKSVEVTVSENVAVESPLSSTEEPDNL